MTLVLEREMKEVKVLCKGVHIVNGQRTLCSQEGTNHTFHPIETKNHGVIYMCPSCYNKKRSYTTENSLVVNKSKKHGFTYSFEMELSKHDDSFVRMLQYNNFLPTDDSTVSIEYKSPIYQSLCGIRKLFRSMNNELSRDYFDYSTGTHCNIGHVDYINDSTISIIGCFYHSLFLPLSQWLELNPTASEEIYGRQIGGWARPINKDTNPFLHRNFINLEHNTHIEFRQCKFVNEDQYIDCVQLNTKIVKAIINNFILHFDSEDFDTTRYKNITAFRRHKAKVTANKLVALLEKECDKRNIPYTSL